MKRAATFQLKDTVMEFDGESMTHVRGPRGMFTVAKSDADMILDGMHPTISGGYFPDRANDIPNLLVKEYGGKVIRPAAKLKFDPKAIY